MITWNKISEKQPKELEQILILTPGGFVYLGRMLDGKFRHSDSPTVFWEPTKIKYWTEINKPDNNK